MNHVLITDYVHPVLITGLRERGYFPHYAPEIERKEVLEWITHCTGLVINTKTVADAEMIEAAPALRWIGRLGSGLDIIDLIAAKQKQIKVLNTPQANANAVAEHVMGMLLGLLRNIPRADQEVRAGLWNREKNRGVELKGKTIGIIGYGHTGSAFASKFAGWDVKIVAYDKYKTGYARDVSFVKESTLEEVMASDIISIHLPLTAETRYMINAAFLSGCRHGVILLNSSRGKILDTAALLDALRSGHVAGACLDVLENEKPDSYSEDEQGIYSALAGMEHVILTPHIAGWTVESKRQISEEILRQLDEI